MKLRNCASASARNDGGPTPFQVNRAQGGFVPDPEVSAGITAHYPFDLDLAGVDRSHQTFAPFTLAAASRRPRALFDFCGLDCLALDLVVGSKTDTHAALNASAPTRRDLR